MKTEKNLTLRFPIKFPTSISNRFAETMPVYGFGNSESRFEFYLEIGFTGIPSDGVKGAGIWMTHAVKSVCENKKETKVTPVPAEIKAVGFTPSLRLNSIAFGQQISAEARGR